MAHALILAEKPRFAGALCAMGRAAGMGVSIAGPPPVCRFKHLPARASAIPRFTDAETNALVEQIGRVAARDGATHLVAADTGWTRWLCQYGVHIGPPCYPMPRRELFDALFDKASFSALAARDQLPHPPTRVVRTPRDAASIDIDPPYVIKPCWGEGGHLVSRAEDRASCAERTAHAFAGGCARAIVQSFVPGQDVDLSLLADDGRIVAHSVQRNLGRVDGHRRIEVFEHDGVLDIGRRLCEATSYTGIAHLDMRIDERSGEPVILECNPRFWASAEQSARLAGVNFLALGLGIT